MHQHFINAWQRMKTHSLLGVRADPAFDSNTVLLPKTRTVEHKAAWLLVVVLLVVAVEVSCATYDSHRSGTAGRLTLVLLIPSCVNSIAPQVN